MTPRVLVPLSPERIDKNLINEKYGTFPFYAFLLYSSENEDFAKFTRTKGGFLHSLSGDNCLISLIENPREWGPRWENYWRNILGTDFENFSEEWMKIGPYDTDVAYNIASQLNIDMNLIPCIVFTESMTNEPVETIHMPIIPDENGYINYFQDLFTAVQRSTNRPDGERLRTLQSEWRSIWVRNSISRFARSLAKSIRNIGSKISTIEIGIMDIISVAFTFKEEDGK